MKKLIFMLNLLFLIGCTNYRNNGRFYVKSDSDGYRVCLDYKGGDTACFTKAINDPLDAKILVEKLNRDMEDNWMESHKK